MLPSHSSFSVTEMKCFVSFCLRKELLLCLFTVCYCLFMAMVFFLLVKSMCPFKIIFECIVSVLYFLHYILRQTVRSQTGYP